MPQTTIRTKLDLAKRLGIARSTLDRYLSLPGAPERGPDGWKLETVNTFVADKAASEATAAKASDKIASLKAREIALRCDRIAFHLQKEKNQFVARVEIAAKLRTALGRMVAIMEQKIVNELPTAVAGLEPAQVRIKARQIFDETLAEIRPLDVYLADEAKPQP